MGGFVCESQHLEPDLGCHGQPAEVSQNWSDVVKFTCTNHQSGYPILHPLKSLDQVQGKHLVEGIPVVDLGDDQSLHQSPEGVFV